MLHSDPHLSGSEKKQMAVEVTKLLYIVVVDDDEESNSFRYTRSVLQSSLQLMGCKPRHAFKISQRVFERIRSECLGDTLPLENKDKSEAEIYIESGLKKADAGNILIPEGDKSKSKLFEMYKRRTTVVIRRKTFLDVACDALTEYKYVGPNQRADLILSCRIRERKESVTVLLCGTSGCGKSTLSALLASRLGITTVISTDSVRHMMRSFVDEKQNPLLWASTYHAGEYLDPVAVAEAKAKRKAKKLAGSGPHDKSDVSGTGKPPLEGGGSGSNGGNVVEVIGRKQMAIEGFKAQSEMVIDSLDRLITAWEERKESVVVEGVHLSLNFVMGLMKKHPSIIPFMVYISNEEKHLERFAVRAKYMTLDPARNKYVKYIRNIRTIQEYLCNRAVKHLVPKINNTNVDRSVASIHATVFSSLRRRSKGENLYDPTTNTVMLVDEEYRNQCDANNLSSKGMFQLIQRKGSSRHLMALLNKDGTVKKAWPVDSGDTMGGGGGYVYGPVSIGRSESVNLQFGNFGISAWANDTGGTSHASSVDESRQGDVSDNGSKYYSSCCSSPKNTESLSKERKEEQSVHGSDEDVDDDPPEGETDEDLSDDDKEQNHDEMEGSVDEGSTKSDEEYDDLAMQDNGYLCDDDEEYYKFNDDDNNIIKISNEEKYKRNLDLFLKNKSTAPSRTCSNVLGEKKMLHDSGSVKLRKRSQSISALKHEKLINSNSPRQSAVL